MGLSGEDCNVMFPEMSPGVHRVQGVGYVAAPSDEATHREMFCFVVMLELFPDVIRNRFVVVRSVSMSACKCVGDLHAGMDCVELAHLTRVFLSQCVHSNCRVLPVHIPGVMNVLADTLSRGKWAEFSSKASEWLQWGRSSDFLSNLSYHVGSLACFGCVALISRRGAKGCPRGALPWQCWLMRLPLIISSRSWLRSHCSSIPFM